MAIKGGQLDFNWSGSLDVKLCCDKKTEECVQQ